MSLQRGEPHTDWKEAPLDCSPQEWQTIIQAASELSLPVNLFMRVIVLTEIGKLRKQGILNV